MMGQVLATCLLLAAQTYDVPAAVLIGIHQVEGGKVGQSVGPNVNGSYDLGPMQINTIWIPQLAAYWGVSDYQAKRWIQDDACTNVGVSAWILRSHLNRTDSLGTAIAHYHSKTPSIGFAYKKRVITAMKKKGLIAP